MKVRELFVRLGVAADDEDLDKFESKLDDVKGAVGDLLGWLTKLAAGFAAVTGAAAGVAAKTADWSEEVVRNADALGMATDKYQELHFAFNQLGASTDDMMDAFSTLTDRALDAQEGSKTYIDEFERLGIAVDDLRGKRPDQIFDMYVRAAQNAEDRTDAVASAVRLFGDDLGRRIMPALTTASDDFDRWRQIARESGIVMDEAFIRQARVIRREWRGLQGRFKGLMYTLGEQLMPTFSLFIKRLSEIIDGFRGGSEWSETFRTFADKLSNDLEKLWDVADRLSEAFSFGTLEKDAIGLYEVVQGILLLITGSSVAGVISSIVSLLASVGVGAAAAIAAKAVAIAAAVAVALLVIEDIVGFFLGWDSVTGRIIDRFGEGSGMLDSMAQFIEEIKKNWDMIKPVVFFIGDILGGMVWNALVSIGRVLKTIISAFFDILTYIQRVIGAVIRFWKTLLAGDVKKAFTGLFADLADAVSKLLRDVMVGLLKVAQNIVEAFVGFLAPALEKMPGVDEGLMDRIRGALDAEADAVHKALTFDIAGSARADQDKADESIQQSTAVGSAGMRYSTPANQPGYTVNPAAVSGTRYETAARQQTNQSQSITIENMTIGEGMSKPKQKRETIDAMSKVQRMSYADASGGER